MGKRFVPVHIQTAKGTNGRPDYTRFHVTDVVSGKVLGSAIKLNTGGWVALPASTTDPVYCKDNTLEAAIEYIADLPR